MPFCTHEGSVISSTVEHIKSICKNADVRDGYSQKGSIVGKNLAKAASEIKEWIKDNSL